MSVYIYVLFVFCYLISLVALVFLFFFFFFNDTATTEIYTLSYTTLFRPRSRLRGDRPHVARSGRPRDARRASTWRSEPSRAGRVQHAVTRSSEPDRAPPRAGPCDRRHHDPCPAPRGARPHARRRHQARAGTGRRAMTIRQERANRAGRGLGACPRAWPALARPGWRAPLRSTLR